MTLCLGWCRCRPPAARPLSQRSRRRWSSRSPREAWASGKQRRVGMAWTVKQSGHGLQQKEAILLRRLSQRSLAARPLSQQSRRRWSGRSPRRVWGGGEQRRAQGLGFSGHGMAWRRSLQRAGLAWQSFSRPVHNVSPDALTLPSARPKLCLCFLNSLHLPPLQRTCSSACPCASIALMVRPLAWPGRGGPNSNTTLTATGASRPGIVMLAVVSGGRGQSTEGG